MVATLFPIVTLVRLEQPEKALAPMLVTPSGMVMLARLVQLEKADSPMVVTLLGIVNMVSVFPAGYAIKEVLFLLYSTLS
jgi:hypothetical protein